MSSRSAAVPASQRPKVIRSFRSGPTASKYATTPRTERDHRCRRRRCRTRHHYRRQPIRRHRHDQTCVDRRHPRLRDRRHAVTAGLRRGQRRRAGGASAGRLTTIRRLSLRGVNPPRSPSGTTRRAARRRTRRRHPDAPDARKTDTRPDPWFVELTLHSVHVADGGGGVPAAGEPHAHAAEAVAGGVLTATLDRVQPGELALEAATARSTRRSRRCRRWSGSRCRPRTPTGGTAGGPGGSRTTRRCRRARLVPPRLDRRLGACPVDVDAPLAGRPLEDLVGRADVKLPVTRGFSSFGELRRGVVVRGVGGAVLGHRDHAAGARGLARQRPGDAGCRTPVRCPTTPCRLR